MEDKVIQVSGSSDAQGCFDIIRSVFMDPQQCRNVPGSSCTLRDYRLDYKGSTNSYYAFSGFTYPLEFLGLKENGDVQSKDFMEKKLRGLCSSTYEQLKQNPSFSPFSYILCFEAAYAHSLLYDGYRFSDKQTKVHYASDLSGVEPGWALGFLLHQSNSFPVNEDGEYKSKGKQHEPSSTSPARNMYPYQSAIDASLANYPNVSPPSPLYARVEPPPLFQSAWIGPAHSEYLL